VINDSSQSQINPPWRWIALALWALTALTYLAFFLLESRLDYIQLQEACQGTGCNWQSLSPAEAVVLESWGLSTRFYASLMVGTAAISVAIYWLLGGLILWQQGVTRIGLAVSLALLIIPIVSISDSDNLFINYPYLLLPAVFVHSIGYIYVLAFIYLFPNGRFYPRLAWATMAVSILVVALGFIYVGFRAQSQNQFPLFALPLSVAAILGIVFQIFRYMRDSTPIERQQTKWVLYGFFLFAIGIPAWIALFGGVLEIPSGEPRLLAVLVGWTGVLFIVLFLPVTIAIAILRYRLWEIDVLIRRTLVYGALTITIGLVYFGLVVLLQGLLTAIGRPLTADSGPQSSVVVVLSTLAIAALFSPLRLRIQTAIDRRFYRRKYDAEKALAAFSQTVREEVDLESLSRSLLRVVEDTMQPNRAALWLAETAGDGSADRIRSIAVGGLQAGSGEGRRLAKAVSPGGREAED
jgi:hypothetical protein